MNTIARRTFIFAAATAGATAVLLGVQRLLYPAFADSDNPQDAGPVKIAQFSADGKPTGIVSLPKVRKNLDAWKKQLTSLQFEVTRRADTEWAFSGPLDKEY